MNVLLGVCGGIAACKAPELVRELGRADCRVRCILTPAASSFCAPLALEILSGHEVWDESYLRPGTGGVEQHVELGQWADVLLVAPATANTISRLAWGLADDLLTTTALMVDGPVVVAPAMHATMWEHPAVRESVARLRQRGVRVVGPDVGPLASGELGVGRLAELPAIASAVLAAASSGDLAGRRVVVTAGPTWEAVDSVRFLANRSSGRMGFAIAERAARRGAVVRLISGPSALAAPHGVERRDVTSALEMLEAVREECEGADVVVMAAAVADYRPASAAAGKLKKRDGGLESIALVENPDILAELARMAPDAVRVGFAAETEDLIENARQKLASKGAHLLVANDVSRRDIGFDSHDNEVVVLRREGEPVRIGKRGKGEVADGILDLVRGELDARTRSAVIS
ncbi:MAG: bifunctional phosphopantothenoylcysteine decarboxylase/phosphopantothenate--cysteine ligase CoaBC [Acidobacteria bacterium]|nr:MAG: bifunctional phosphopantothenoylcysteine decarboxylase/phosphopantothenate--cysteine ligase CoaBC [Acidobacteriota bacterium]REK01046.1 MAG: bifunctional phosphopantothenoylcysteine decarboxylase/phosphopantothenate--cysteine ligase CoaBC [Acidobacteriota bacterium]